MSKFASLILAISFSFFLFVGMTYLIKPKAMDIADTEPHPPISISYEVDDTKPKSKDRIPPRPVIEPKPEFIATTTDLPKPSKDTTSFIRVAHVPHKQMDGIAGITMGGPSRDGDAQPTVRINPAYPHDAQVKGIEGYVTMRFDISELGRPINVEVVKSNPRGIFERQARKALRKWKYNPKIVDEKAVIQANQSVTLSFEFEKESGVL